MGDKDHTGANSESPPPPYSDQDAANATLDEVITPFTGLSLSNNQMDLTPENCLVHLKLLEAIAVMRLRVSKQDGAFGVNCPNDQEDATLQRLEEKRWSIFVENAAIRFQAWWHRVVQPTSSMLSVPRNARSPIDVNGDGSRLHFAGPHEKTSSEANHLPPLDVLMVWHAFMLNPRTYLSDCIRFGKLDVWRTGMPWKHVNAAIDSRTFAYNVSESAKWKWSVRTNFEWDQDLSETDTIINCASCKLQIQVPLTTQSWTERPSDGTGYTDSKFIAWCRCGFQNNHETRRVEHFLDDLAMLLAQDVPMPGTLLNARGNPDTVTLVGDMIKPEVYDFPNSVLRLGYGVDILREARKWEEENKTSSRQPFRMEKIRVALEDAAKIALMLRKVYAANTNVRTVSKGSRFAMQRMLSAYWNNGSIFSIDLVGAVIRQGSFISKMHEIDWLHSPSAMSTMSRVVEKYHRFFRLMKHEPEKMFVPTLDVDLAWHTHQLSPQVYYAHCWSNTKLHTFIDHDDKISEVGLSEGFAYTSKAYFKKYGEVYSECTCWYCEAINEYNRPTGLSRLVGGGRSKNEQLDAELTRLKHSPNVDSDPAKNPHISTHNVVSSNDKYADWKAKIHQSWLARHAQKSQQRRAKAESGGKSSYTRGYDTPLYPYIIPVQPVGVYACDPYLGCNIPGTYWQCNGGSDAPGWTAACGGGTGSCGTAYGGCVGGGGFGGGCGGGGGGGGGGGCGGGGGGGCGGGGGGGGGGCGGGG